MFIARCSRFARYAVAWSVLAGPVAVFADVSHLIRYQGVLTSATNEVPLEGEYDVTFRLYDAAIDGTLLWEEVHVGVPVSRGAFSVLLGSFTPLDATLFDQPQGVWLAMALAGEDEMSPRQPITSVPVALRAETADVAEALTVPITTSTIEDDANRLVPSGAIILWSGTNCPEGYARLSTYDDAFLVGAAVPGVAGGADVVTLTVDQLPAHTHAGPSHAHSTPAHTHTVKYWASEEPGSTTTLSGVFDGDGSNNWSRITGDPPGTPEGGGTTSTDGTGPTSATGGGQAFDNRPSFRTILLCEKS